MSNFFLKRKSTDKAIVKDIVKLEDNLYSNGDNTLTIKGNTSIKNEAANDFKNKKIKLINNKTTDKIVVKKNQEGSEDIFNDYLYMFANDSNFTAQDFIDEKDNEYLKEHIKSIGQVEFTMLSSEEVKRISVCEVNTTKWDGENSLFDPRMGVQDKNNSCETCGQKWKSCPGHFGYIQLDQPIPHPIQYKLIIKYLQIFCRECYKLIINRDRIKILGFNKYKGEHRLGVIYEESEKIPICPHCSTAVPKIFNNEDSYFMKFSKTEQKPYKLKYSDICKIFASISTEDFFELGFTDERLTPRNLIIQNLLVLPPCARPYYLNGEESCHDDLTYKYIDIIKVNNKIKETKIGRASCRERV